MFLQKCSLHGRTANKLCGISRCCQILCDYCFLEHAQQTGHATALCLGIQSLNFFTTLTGYTHYKVFDWVEAIRKGDFFSLFTSEGGDSILCEGGSMSEELSVIGVRVLEEFQTLAQNNRQFVLNNKNSQQLLNPQFLRDIFKLSTEKWEASAEIILTNLANQVSEKFKVSGGLPRYRIRQHFLNSIQTYKTQILDKNIKKIIYTVKDILTNINQLEQLQVKLNASELQNKQELAAEVVNYELPYSIKQIQSFEEIGQRCSRTHNTVCSIAHEPEMIEEVQEPLEQSLFDEMKNQLERLRIENAALQEENRLLKTRNSTIEAEKIELAAKLGNLEKLNKENQQQPQTSTSNKFILKIPARVLSLADQSMEDPKPTPRNQLTVRVNPQMFSRKVRVLKL